MFSYNKNMKNLSAIFHAALIKCLEGQPWGSKTKLAKEAGITTGMLGDILAARAYGSEETKRSIAAAFGYPGPKYEEFLNIGRRELGLLLEGESDGDSGTANQEAEDWKAKYLAELKSHDDTLNVLLAARQKIAELEKRGFAAPGAGLKRPTKKTG